MISIDISPEMYVYLFLFVAFCYIFFHYSNYGTESFIGILAIFLLLISMYKKIYNNYKKKDYILQYY